LIRNDPELKNDVLHLVQKSMPMNKNKFNLRLPTQAGDGDGAEGSE